MDVNMEDKNIVVLMRRLAGEEQAPAGYPVQRLHALVGNVRRNSSGFRELEEVTRFCLWWLAETGVEDPVRAACSAGLWMRDSYHLGDLADQSAGVLADRAFNLLVGLAGAVAQAAYTEPGQVLPQGEAPVRMDAASDWNLVQEMVVAVAWFAAWWRLHEAPTTAGDADTAVPATAATVLDGHDVQETDGLGLNRTVIADHVSRLATSDASWDDHCSLHVLIEVGLGALAALRGALGRGGGPETARQDVVRYVGRAGLPDVRGVPRTDRLRMIVDAWAATLVTGKDDEITLDDMRRLVAVAAWWVADYEDAASVQVAVRPGWARATRVTATNMNWSAEQTPWRCPEIGEWVVTTEYGAHLLMSDEEFHAAYATL